MTRETKKLPWVPVKMERVLHVATAEYREENEAGKIFRYLDGKNTTLGLATVPAGQKVRIIFELMEDE
jgi:hypothetical protein